MYGYLASDWDDTKMRAHDLLIEVARRREPISYSDLNRQLCPIRFDLGMEHGRAALGEMLGQISSATVAQEIGMLSALVVRKHDGFPSEGFFNCAEKLGYKTAKHDREKFWLDQFRRVVHHYAGETAEAPGAERS